MIIAKYLSEMWTAVGPAVGNHLWQSTLFAVVAGLLTLLLRKNQARARYWIWMAASLKFLIPFSLLVGAGSYLGSSRAVNQVETGFTFAMDEFSQPFAQPALPVKSQVASVAANPLANLTHLLPGIVLSLWLCGFVAVLVTWFVRWRQMSASIRNGSLLRDGREVKALRRLERAGGIRRRIEILLSRASLEPGIFGIARPVLVWPYGISERLGDAHVEAILAHEVGHVRRRDNLFAAIHMSVEAIFWFHPLVWFLGTRLTEEREVACDEEVLELGSERQVYAESILKICEFCVGSPLACVSGVTGADLKKRIVRIMTPDTARKLNFRKKLLLAFAGLSAIALPVEFGLAHAAPRAGRLQSLSSSANTPDFKYEVAAIKPTKSNPNSHHSNTTDDEFRATNVTLTQLIRQAYLLQFGPSSDDGRVVGGPNWMDSDGFDLDAKMESATADTLNKLSPIEREAARQRMLQSLLADRFRLVVHTEAKELPVFSLEIAKKGLKLHEAKPGETYDKAYRLPNGAPAGAGLHSDKRGEITGQAVSMTDLARWLSRQVGRTVVDRTGLKGTYDFTLTWNPENSETSADDGISIFEAIQQQLGLKLESGKGPVEVIVIEHAEKPSGN